MAHHQDELALFSAPPAPASRHFLGWDRPLLTLATGFLASEWTDGPLDLSSLSVLVPTRNASRRLREALALKAAGRGTGCLPPRIYNPDDLLTDPAPPRPLASRLDTLMAWVEILRGTRPGDFRHLFPVDPADQNLSWALKTARDFLSVQSLLGESARTAGSVARQFSNSDFEPERWAEFARLEDEVFRLLRSQNLEPRALSRAEAINTFQLPAVCSQLLLIGIVDPPPALEKLLPRLAATTPTTILIHAPASLAHLFDELGRPAEDWTTRHLDIPDGLIHQSPNPEAQARLVRDRLAVHPAPEAVAAIGVPDAEVIAPLQKTLADSGLATFDPGGKPLASHGFCHFLRTLHDVAATGSFHSFRELLRVPGVSEAAGRHEIPEHGEAFASSKILIQFDRFHEHHLPLTLDDASNLLDHLVRGLDKAVLVRVLSWARHWLRVFEKEPLADALTAFLTEVYENSSLPPGEDFEPVVKLLHKVLDDFAHPSLEKLAPSDRLQIFLSLLEEQTLSSRRPQNAVELPGWLELPWESAPHLLVTGFNDGLVPETIQAHPWLPDRARRALGLRHNVTRHARDAYLLASLHASRKTDGHLDLIFGRANASGDPLRPSRLLFALPEDQLAGRVALLFHHDVAPEPPLPYRITWQLTPPPPPAETIARLNVTSFASYLACPFRFYLGHVLRMREPETDLLEMNAPAFGEFAHKALEEFTRTTAATSSDAAVIRDCFRDLLSDHLQRRFGSNRTLPLLIQEQSLRNRLDWWAAQEAVQRAEGWTILEAETGLAADDNPFRIGGIEIRGRIDRIERHPDEGIRVIDFKTSTKATMPEKAHLAFPRAIESYPGWRQVDMGKKTAVWTNLQLPLYLLALAKRYPSTRLTAGYGNLPPTQSDTGLALWPELDEHLLASAQACAEAVVEAIVANRFWPPAEKVTYDDFSSILFGNPEEAVDAVNLATFRIQTNPATP